MAAGNKKTTTSKKKVKTGIKKTSANIKKKSNVKKATNKAVTKTKNTKVKIPKKQTKKRVSKNTEIKNLTENEIAAIERGDEPMTVVDHLDEFRSRFMISLISIVALTLVSFIFSSHLVDFIKKPFAVTDQQLNIFNLAGGFWIRLKVSFVAAFLLSIPIIVIQIWQFIMPAVTKEDRRFTRITILSTIFLFYGGIAFVFFVILPFAIPMLIYFIPEGMLTTIGADDYFSFILLSSIAMGALFELPIVVMVLAKLGIITPQFLIQKRKYSIVIIWIIAALITPQDPLTQAIVAIPLMLLYEISIIISRIIFIRKRNKLMA